MGFRTCLTPGVKLQLRGLLLCLPALHPHPVSTSWLWLAVHQPHAHRFPIPALGRPSGIMPYSWPEPWLFKGTPGGDDSTASTQKHIGLLDTGFLYATDKCGAIWIKLRRKYGIFLPGLVILSWGGWASLKVRSPNLCPFQMKCGASSNRRDQALKLWSGSTDSRTLDYQRANPREYQIVRTHTWSKPLEYKTRHHPTTSSTLCRMPHLNNKQSKSTNPIISRQDYHLTQPCPSEGKQANKQTLTLNLTI